MTHSSSLTCSRAPSQIKHVSAIIKKLNLDKICEIKHITQEENDSRKTRERIRQMAGYFLDSKSDFHRQRATDKDI